MLGSSPYEAKPKDDNVEASSSAEQEWGRENGPIVPNPNFAPTPWRRFEWGNEEEAQGPEPEPTSWGRSRLTRSPRRGEPPSPSSSRSHSPDQCDKMMKNQEVRKAMEKNLQAKGRMKGNLRESQRIRMTRTVTKRLQVMRSFLKT